MAGYNKNNPNPDKHYNFNEPPKKVKVIKVHREGDGYGYQVHEVLESSLGPCLEANVPDIFGIFLVQVTKKLRELFGI